MKPANLLTVDWAKLYGYLSEAVDHAGFLVVQRVDGVMNLVHKDTQPSQGVCAVTDEMVDAACRAYYDTAEDTVAVDHTCMEAALKAALAAPPAQTVDLGRFRKLASWVVNCAGHGINDSHRRMGEELLAVIDSQVVEFERAIPTRRRESAVELLLQLGFVWNNQRWEDRRQTVGEPTYFSLDMDGIMVPDPDGQWVRR